VWRKLCLQFSLPIESYWSQNTSQKIRNTARITSSWIFFQSWNEKKGDISGGGWDFLRAHGPLKKSWWSQNPRQIRYERPRTLSWSPLFSWPESMWLLVFWNGQGKNEGLGVSHSSRYSRRFDGDLEWPHFQRHSICVPWVADPAKLGHREWRRVLFWIEEKEWEFTRETFPGHFVCKTYPTLCIIVDAPDRTSCILFWISVEQMALRKPSMATTKSSRLLKRYSEKSLLIDSKKKQSHNVRSEL
jgi:hypothetical protein